MTYAASVNLLNFSLFIQLSTRNKVEREKESASKGGICRCETIANKLLYSFETIFHLKKISSSGNFDE